jgi:hypothetical protein
VGVPIRSPRSCIVQSVFSSAGRSALVPAEGPFFTEGECIMEQHNERQEQKSRFQIEQLEERIAPTIVQVNGGGNVPNGNANGVPATNPAGHAPPGQNM